MLLHLIADYEREVQESEGVIGGQKISSKPSECFYLPNHGLELAGKMMSKLSGLSGSLPVQKLKKTLSTS